MTQLGHLVFTQKEADNQQEDGKDDGPQVCDKYDQCYSELPFEKQEDRIELGE